MITRIFRRQPRRLALLAAAGLVVMGVAASLALALVSDTGTYSVEVADKSISSPWFSSRRPRGWERLSVHRQLGQQPVFGTGIFDPFVRLQGSPHRRRATTRTAPSRSRRSPGAGRMPSRQAQSRWSTVTATAIRHGDTAGSCSSTSTSQHAKYISLNDVEIWFTTERELVGYHRPNRFPRRRHAGIRVQWRDPDPRREPGLGSRRSALPDPGARPFVADTLVRALQQVGLTAGTSPDRKGLRERRWLRGVEGPEDPEPQHRQDGGRRLG